MWANPKSLMFTKSLERLPSRWRDPAITHGIDALGPSLILRERLTPDPAAHRHSASQRAQMAQDSIYVNSNIESMNVKASCSRFQEVEHYEIYGYIELDT